MICDVSESVRAASLFMLELVHAAQELFSGTRSFVFVSELARRRASSRIRGRTRRSPASTAARW